MVFSILVLLGGAFFIRLMLLIFQYASNKVRAVVGLVFATIMGLWSLSLWNQIRAGTLVYENSLFTLLIVPLMLGIGIGFIFLTVNYEQGDNWYEFFSIGNVSFGQDISIGIVIPLIAVIVVMTLINLLILGFLDIVPFILYAIVQLYFAIRVFFTPD